ncbi:RluA family pseudouridine synthase [uncultured Veillonella sp.]|uniref:RluA family pseudouridine synthase n=1 Tax=uncultured Veillonella sp. TaxID=159268 RepID=UPI0025947152|nr:RluA family pseudouridine synthase [uncultured Veillonella sp.]
MKPLLSIFIPPDQRRISINHAVKQHGVSQAMRRRLRTHGRFQRNGLPCTWDTILSCGDCLEVYLEAPRHIEPWSVPLSIAFEDEHLLVINKPGGLLMHPTSDERYHTLANAVIAYYNSTGQTDAAFHPVHRLDKDTSGLVIIAKNAFVQHSFSKKRVTFRKIYDGLCDGNFPAAKLTVHWPIDRKAGSIIERCCALTGKWAHTDIECLAHGQRLSYVRFLLHTGRTHQIRVHMAHLGFPLLGDDIYGGSTDLLTTQALHAGGLQFVHPMTGAYISLTAPIPDAWKPLLQAHLGTIKSHNNAAPTT